MPRSLGGSGCRGRRWSVGGSATPIGVGGLGRSGPAGPAGGDRRGRGGGRHLDQAAGVAGGDALVGAAAGATSSGSRSPRWPGSGGSGTCSRGGSRRSSSPPTPSWTPRSATWSDCTWRLRTRRWCCRSTKNPRCRPWTGPRRSCRCDRDCRRSRPTTTSGTAPPPVRRAGGRHREGHRRLPPPAHPRRVPGLPQTGRQGLPAGEAAHRLRQLRHPQTPEGEGLAGQATRGSACTSPRPPDPG